MECEGKEDGTMKEVERERMLRLEAEQRLRDTRQESDTCHARLKALQEDFTRMEETVQSMLQYKTKIDQLKQEKANLSGTYESSIQKHRNHISKLERENIMLLNQVKKLESQLNTKSESGTGSHDKSKLLLERLKILEAENSGLVLENEQQRQQYEKCLDEIANQVVQALLAQKSLREECTKLQARVQDLEIQNQQLRSMFQKRIRYASDSHLQKSSPQSPDSSKASSTVGSMSFDESFGLPQMSSPPPWLRHKLEEKLRETEFQQQERDRQTKIETEFPANNSSPKIKHINVYDRSYGSWGRTPPKPQRKGKTTSRKSPRNSLQGTSAVAADDNKFCKASSENKSCKASSEKKPELSSPDHLSHTTPQSAIKMGTQLTTQRSNSSSPKPKQQFRSQYFYDYSDEDSDCRPMTKDLSSSSTVSLNELLDSSLEGADLPTDEDFYSDWSPSCLSPKPLPTELSAMKTMQNFMFPPAIKPSVSSTSASSIKTATETSHSSKSNTQSTKNSITSSPTPTAVSGSLLPIPITNHSQTSAPTKTVDLSSNADPASQAPVTQVSPTVTTSQAVQGKKEVVSIYGYTNGASPKPCRPDNLILVPREKTFIMSSMSSTSSDENKTLSSSSPHSVSEKSVASQTFSPSKKISPPRKISPIVEKRSPKSKHYVEIQVKKPLSPTKKSAVDSSNKSKVAAIVPTPRSPKKSPPPVPKKPARTGTNTSKLPEPKKLDKASEKSPGKKLQGIVNPMVNSSVNSSVNSVVNSSVNSSVNSNLNSIVNPMVNSSVNSIVTSNVNSNLVNPVVNSVIMDPSSSNFPVLDLGFGPKWAPPQETNLDNVRVERSGSRDDGYSTMSSDIQPEAMEKYSDASTGKKDSGSKGADSRPDASSDPDSAMENSSHSTTELQNSTHSLSSQVSTSSGENLLSPSSKVREMMKVFEDDTPTIKSAKKTGQPQPPVPHSPLAPKLRFFQTSESRSLENLASEKLEESPELSTKTSWNYHSFTEPRIPPPATRYNFPDNQVISLPIGEDHLLEDIPEDRELETIPHASFTTYSRRLSTPPPVPTKARKRSREESRRQIERALSDSSITAPVRPKQATLYDDFCDGSWNSGRVFDRSVSVSEMDMIDSSTRRFDPPTRPVQLSSLEINEAQVDERVKNIIKGYLMSKMSMTASTTDSDSDSDLEAALKVNREWLKKRGGYVLPNWQPKETMEALKKGSTPSPVSIKKFDSSNAEDWLLKFSKEEIESHLATPTFPSSSLALGDKQNPYTAYTDLSHFTSSSDTSTIIFDSSPSPGAAVTKSSDFTSAEKGRHSTVGDGEEFSLSTENKCANDLVFSPSGSSKRDDYAVSQIDFSAELLRKRDGSGSKSSEIVDSYSPSSSSSYVGEGNSFVSEEGNTEDGLQSPSEDQKKFHSEFYSLCLVESNRSLVSSSSHETDIHKLVAKEAAILKDFPASSAKDKEFDEISRQIQSLSKTVNDLHNSLSSLNSADSNSREDLLEHHVPNKSAHSANGTGMDGYHWEEDEFYMTPCGGEVIIGSDSLLHHEDSSDWIHDVSDANHSGEIKEEFYEIQVNGENCTNISGYVYNGNQSDDAGHHDASFDELRLSHHYSNSVNHLADPAHRANVVDSMFASGADSNDSLASDIGLDHMMCQRLVGRKARHEALRCSSMPRTTLDFSKFFIRFDQPEKEAVAAFNFLEDISTSTSESGSEQRLFKPEEEAGACYPPGAGVYIVDNHNSRPRRGDKVRRRRKMKQKSAPSPVSSLSRPGKSPSSTSKISREALNTSSESPEVCAGNLSLSDSCCESFSSSDQSINDLTML